MLVFAVAIASVAWSFSGDQGVMLKPSWSQAIDEHESHKTPPPVITDLDGDGVPEVLLASPEGRLVVISPAADRTSAAALPGTIADSPWRQLPVRRSASLRSQTGLALGRRPLAIAAGSLGGGRGRGGEQRIAVALTEDWTVLAFDANLHTLWEHSVGVRRKRGRSSVGATTATVDDDVDDDDPTWREEVALLVAPTAIYTGDRGVVIVGGHTEHHPHNMNAQHDGALMSFGARGHDSAADGNTGGLHASPGAPAPSAAPTLAPDSVRDRAGSGSSHFSYHALEGGTGHLRWSHRESDFHSALHGDEHFTPQMDYKLDLAALGGGGDAGMDGRHEGERPWRIFADSMLAMLPLTWRHHHDTTLHLRRFERARRGSHRTRRQRTAATAAARATGSHHLQLTGALLSAGRNNATTSSTDEISSQSPSAAPPNVLVARRRDGIEVLHLYTGRPLTQLPLAAHVAHGDVNGDGSVDHVQSLSSHETNTRVLSQGAAAAAAGAKGGKHHKGHAAAAEALVCLALVTSGVPARDELWNASVCNLKSGVRPGKGHGGGHTGRRGPKERLAQGVVPPLMVRQSPAAGHATPTMDSVFLASDGRVTCVRSDGSTRWAASTDAGWRVVHPSGLPANGELLPSLSAYAPTPDDAAGGLILAVGEGSMCMLGAVGGESHGCVKLPHAPTGPALIGDFSADGVADIILPCAHAVLGVRVAAGVGSILAKLFFGFVTLALVLALAAKHSYVDEDDLDDGESQGGAGWYDAASARGGASSQRRKKE